MTNPFEPLEEQLIRSSLTSKTDEEIAELLERTVEDVQAKINELTGGANVDRSREIILEREELARQKQIKKAKAVKPKVIRKKEPAKENRSQRNGAETAWARQREANGKRVINRHYKTLAVDYSQKKSVKVDTKTWVWVDKNVDPKEAIRQYQMNQLNKGPRHLPTNNNKYNVK